MHTPNEVFAGLKSIESRVLHRTRPTSHAARTTGVRAPYVPLNQHSRNNLRIFLHDYGAYPFTPPLARELACRGHRVDYAFCASLTTTPGGKHTLQVEPHERLRIHPIELPSPLNKYSFVKRFLQERQYGQLLGQRFGSLESDVVVSANCPLDAQSTLWKAAAKRDTPTLYWLQDLLGVAADRLLRQKIPVVGRRIGKHYLSMERRLLRNSDHVVAITDGFADDLQVAGLSRSDWSVLENWAPVEQIDPKDKRNDFAVRRGWSDHRCVLYTGTLGMKHNPDLLLSVALEMQKRGGGEKMVVTSQGIGAEYLLQRKSDLNLETLQVLPYVPFDDVPGLMGSADVLTAVLSEDAAKYSVSSKVLAYACAERPISAAIPKDNRAAELIRTHGWGSVCEPTDEKTFVRQTMALLDDAEASRRCGQAARTYAEKHFAIGTICDAFEAILEKTVRSQRPSSIRPS